MTGQELFDEETGLPGRSLVEDRLMMALRGAERTDRTVALLLVDLVSIESPDAAAGDAAVGDAAAVLREAADRLVGSVRGGDSVGRLSPTTFAVVLAGEVDTDAVDAVARRILFELSSPVSVGLRQYFVMARLGGTVSRPEADDHKDMLRRATEALADAKDPSGELFVLRRS